MKRQHDDSRDRDAIPGNKKVKIDTITIKGVKYAHNTETGELYDYNAYAKEKKVVPMGRVAYVKDIPVLVN